MFTWRRAAGAVVAAMVLTASAVGAQADTGEAVADETQYSIGPAAARQIGEHGALLFPVFTSERAEVSAGAEPDFFAYCIEMSVRARFDVDVDLGPWREFPGSNRFTDDPRVQQRVGWIIAHSYPTLSLAELREVTGISGLTQREAIAGTQYAIWHLTDGDGRELSPNAEALRAYLTGPANTGLPERATRPGLTLEVAPGANDLIGAPIGPITVGTNVEPVTLETEDGVNIVDGAGAPVDVMAVSAGAEIFLELPAGAEPGRTTLRGQVRAAQASGAILKVPAADERQSHAQTLILVTNGTATSRAELEIEWRAPKLPTVVAPLTPEVDYGPCEEPGGEREVRLLPVPTEGITYAYDEAALYPGAVVEVAATALPGYELAPAPGWDVQEDGSATTTVTIEARECPPEPAQPGDDPEPAPAEESEEPEVAEESDDDEDALAETGAATMGLLAIGAGLSIGGVTILGNRWRRT